MSLPERLRSLGRRALPALALAAGLLPMQGLLAQSQPKLAELPSMADTRQLATTTCASCHGAEGQGNPAAGFPRLAGIGTAYLLRQLDAFHSGYRKNAVMQPIAATLSRQQRIELATYYAGLPTKVAVANKARLEPDPANRGEWLALRGRWPDGIPPCGHCHGPTGLGIGDDFPPLSGQPAAYLAAQLNGWKHGMRPPGPLALMVLIAGALDSADIAAVAKYYSELPAAEPGPARIAGGAR